MNLVGFRVRHRISNNCKLFVVRLNIQLLHSRVYYLKFILPYSMQRHYPCSKMYGFFILLFICILAKK